MNIFKGTGVALTTPFKYDGSIDKKSLINLVEYVIDGGVDFLVVMGTTSEVATLTKEEKEYIIKTIVDVNNRRLPLMIGIGGNNTSEVVKSIENFPNQEDFEGILSVSPYYNKPNQNGLFNHFKIIAEKSPLPLYLYNVPGRTGVNINVNTVKKLVQECNNIIGIKEAGGNFEQITDLLSIGEQNFDVLSGDDGITLPMISIGGQGVISVAANIIPQKFSKMVNLGINGDFINSRKLHIEMRNLLKLLFEEGNPVGIKAALKIAGIIDCDYVRPPLFPASNELIDKIRIEI